MISWTLTALRLKEAEILRFRCDTEELAYTFARHVFCSVDKGLSITLQTAVKHLLPISFHPRSRPSEPAAQQLHFCNLASSLLDEASRNNTQVPPDVESLITIGDNLDPDDTAALALASDSGLRPRKYALVQHLPSGDWWSSASSSTPAVDGEAKDLKNLYTAKADLVAIFPTASASDIAYRHTLGDYVTKKPAGVSHHRPPPPRRVSCGKFLYYGPYASFAPSFDQDGVEVGRIAMGEVIYHQEMKRRLRALVKGKRRAFASRSEGSQGNTEDIAMQEASGESEAGPSEGPTELVKGIEALLPEEEVEAIKASLGTLEMEQAVEELLQRNAKALQRLEELQLARFSEQGTGSSIVEVGSEEWDVGMSHVPLVFVMPLTGPAYSPRHLEFPGSTRVSQATPIQQRIRAVTPRPTTLRAAQASAHSTSGGHRRLVRDAPRRPHDCVPRRHHHPRSLRRCRRLPS